METIRIISDKFQFVEQNSIEWWCDFGANLKQHFIKRYSRYSRYQTVFLKLQEIISTFGRKLQKTLCQAGCFLLSLREQLWLPFGQVISLDWLRQVMSDCVALRGCGQSYHNYAKRIITFAKQTHNSKLKPSHLQRIQSQNGWIYRARFALIKKGGSTCKELSRPIYFLPFLWYNTTNR